MYNHISFSNGSNSYISMTTKNFLSFFKNYEISFIKNGLYHATKRKTKATYQEIKNNIEEIAIDWQLDFNNNDYSYYELYEYSSFFEEMGKKYGLLRIFRENGIC